MVFVGVYVGVSIILYVLIGGIFFWGSSGVVCSCFMSGVLEVLFVGLRLLLNGRKEFFVGSFLLFRSFRVWVGR